MLVCLQKTRGERAASAGPWLLGFFVFVLVGSGKSRLSGEEVVSYLSVLHACCQLPTREIGKPSFCACSWFSRLSGQLVAQAWCEALHLACSEEHAAKGSCTARVRVYIWESALTMQHRAAGLLRRVVLVPCETGRLVHAFLHTCAMLLRPS